MADLNGVICINKPQEFTSFDVVAKMRGITRTRKIGHAGTLDPMATGVLPLLLGTATKACDLIPDDGKSYVADFRLGCTTDTDDIWGTVLTQEIASFRKSEVEEKLGPFRGEISQIPPMYSAIQVNGQRLYDMARRGVVIEREPRTVVISSLELLEFDEGKQEGKLAISCSKGTYIRSVCRDLGEALGCGGVMTGLVRTRAAGFSLSDCITLEQAQEYACEGDFSPVLLPVERLFAGLPRIRLNEAQSRMFRNGIRLDLNRVRYQISDGYQTVYDDKNCFMGLAGLDFEKMELVVKKMFLERK